jgi:FKBP-type peptidyl-prolyl cis-trans isomerase FkpA
MSYKKLMIQERNSMRKLIICGFIFLFALPAWAIQPQTEDQKTLYAMGADMAKNLSVLNLSVEEYEFVKQGMTDLAAGKKLEAEPEAYSEGINRLFQTRIAAAVQKQKELAKPYLENAAREPGAEKTASGLIYKPIKVGTGTQPKASDIVKVDYVGSFIDGKEFDSSVKRGQSVEFSLGKVIPCWTEGVGKMKVGGKARLVCPSDIAYGDQGRPPVILGGTTLVFEVELLDVKSESATATPTPQKPTAPKAKAKK